MKEKEIKKDDKFKSNRIEEEEYNEEEKFPYITKENLDAI